MSEPILSARVLNRTLLERQMLLERVAVPLTEAMERMGGMQTQAAPSGYIGLWSRLRRFERQMLTRALEERAAIQGTLMRVTIHTVSSADYWPMAAGVRRARRTWFAAVNRRLLDTLDPAAGVDAVREELADGPLPMRELIRRFASRGLRSDAARWVGLWVDLVRVPPSGTWERRRADLYALAERWIEPVEVTEADGIAHLVARHLGAFGPAPLRDIAGWMGLKVGEVRAVADTMDLRSYRDESGRVLVDLPGATLADADAPAPPRFIAVWDPILLVHARRAAVLPEALRPAVFNTRTPQSTNTFLLDGQVAGTWRFESGEIRLEPLRPLTAAERRDLEDEAHGLAEFHR